MDLGLSGKRGVVTGASKGIGLAITRGLVTEGVTVVTGSRHTSQSSISSLRMAVCTRSISIWLQIRARLD